MPESWMQSILRRRVPFSILWLGLALLQAGIVQVFARMFRPDRATVVIPPDFLGTMFVALIPAFFVAVGLVGFTHRNPHRAGVAAMVAIGLLGLYIVGTSESNGLRWMSESMISWYDWGTNKRVSYSWTQVTDVEVDVVVSGGRQGPHADPLLWLNFDDGNATELWSTNVPPADEQLVVDEARLIRAHHIPVHSIDPPSPLFSQSEKSLYLEVATLLQ